MPEDRAKEEISFLLIPNRLQHDYEFEWEEDGKKKKRDWTKEELYQIHTLRMDEVYTNRFKVNKKLFPDLRNPVKNIVYGINYGAGEEKVAETLNFAPFYAKLAMQAMREELPDAFAYLDKISKFGVKNGFVIFNDRTNSRHWFQSWLEAYQRGRDLNSKEKSAIERACKNYGISGTQADMIKEAMVAVDRYIVENKIEFKWLMQVHDELLFAHKIPDLGETIAKIIIDTCNLYLKNIEMKVEGGTKTYWDK